MKFLAAAGRGLLTLATLAGLAALFAYAGNDWQSPWAESPTHGDDWCAAHEVPLSECTECNPELQRGGTFSVLEREPEEGESRNCLIKITLADGVAEEIGIESVPVEMQTISERLEANAETMYPPSSYARVTPLVSGVVREVPVALGSEVEAGDVLAVLDAPQVGQAKAEYINRLDLLALRRNRLSQEQEFLDKKYSVRASMLEAETLVSEAEIQVQESAQLLAGLGISQDDIQKLAETKDTSPLVTVAAPFTGTVTEVSTVIGERASPEHSLFGIADMQRMWLHIDIYEQDLPRIEKGQRVYFRIPALPGRKFRGKVVALGGAVDEKTRTIRVYAELKNADALLRAWMFGQAQIVIKPKEPKLVIPKAALQNDGDCNLVFLRLKENVYRSRGVDIGAVFENGYEITGGLREGDRVVTTGSFLLKTEVLRGQIGAG